MRPRSEVLEGEGASHQQGTYSNRMVHSVHPGEKLRLWEPIDPKIVDPAQFVQTAPAVACPCTFSLLVSPMIRAERSIHRMTFTNFRTSRTSRASRALRSRGNETLELALLADGVEPSGL